jgi:hypothetical protein
MPPYCHVYAWRKWRVLVRMIGFIGTLVTVSLNHIQIQSYRWFTHTHTGPLLVPQLKCRNYNSLTESHTSNIHRSTNFPRSHNLERCHCHLKLKTCSEQSRAVAYWRQPASTVTLGFEPRWDPWPYICSVSRLSFFSSFFVPPLIKGRGWAFFVFGVPLLHLLYLWLSLYSLPNDHTENTAPIVETCAPNYCIATVAARTP